MDQSLSHVYWIGGSPCSGKSAIAAVLAAAHRLAIYSCDEEFFRHRELVTATRQPVLHRIAHAGCDELWMRPVSRQIAETIAVYHEEFPFILADLARFPTTRPMIAEGAALLPELVERCGADQHRAVWIVPTEAFQRTHYAMRPWRHDVLRDCADPERAWRNWMARDAGFARVVAREAEERGCRVLTVDGRRSIEENAQTVARWLGLTDGRSSSAGPDVPR